MDAAGPKLNFNINNCVVRVCFVVGNGWVFGILIGISFVSASE